MVAVIQPSDAGVIRCTRGAAPCRPSSQPWVIAAASLGSGMAFLDSTVMNVALPAVQADLEVSARDVQWVFGAFALVLAAFLLVGALSETATGGGAFSSSARRSSPSPRPGVPSPLVLGNSSWLGPCRARAGRSSCRRR